MSELKLSRDRLAEGFSYPEMVRRARSGVVQHVRRGAYASSDDKREAQQSYRLLIEATVAQSRLNSVVRHQSAAVLHDLPLWTEIPSQVHLTHGRR